MKEGGNFMESMQMFQNIIMIVLVVITVKQQMTIKKLNASKNVEEVKQNDENS